jgi:hypothetical protein
MNMERIVIEEEVKDLYAEINSLEKELLKIQTLLNTKKMQVKRDEEILEIMDFKDLL